MDRLPHRNKSQLKISDMARRKSTEIQLIERVRETVDLHRKMNR